jgi:hypothetical protein
MRRFLIILLAVLAIATFTYAQGEAQPAATQPADPAATAAAPAAPAATSKPVVKIKIGGAVRYRFQYDQKKQTKLGAAETTENRERNRIRVKLGVTANIADRVEVGAMIGTGGVDSNKSQNLTLGDNGNYASGSYVKSMGLKEIDLHMGYIKANFLSKMLHLTFGKFKDPLYSTKFIINGDINPEGMVQSFKMKMGNMSFGLNLAEYVLQNEIKNTIGVTTHKHSRWLIAPQLFFKAKFGMLSMVLAPAMYLWTNRSANHSVVASDYYEGKFAVLDVYFELGVKLGGNPLKLKAEFAYNMAKNECTNGFAGDGIVRAGSSYLKDHKKALKVLLAYGKTKKLYDYELEIGFVSSQTYAMDGNLVQDEFTGGQKTGWDTSVPMGIFAKVAFVVLPKTVFSIEFIYAKTKVQGYLVSMTDVSESKAWYLKVNLEAKF